MTITLSQQIELAAEYRTTNAHDASIDYTQGYIVITGDEVQGWSRAPRPESWVPGTVAIDPDGKAMVATGGNAYDGADNWESVAQASREQAEDPATTLIYLPEIWKDSANRQAEKIGGDIVLIGYHELANLLRLVKSEATSNQLKDYSSLLFRTLQHQVDREISELMNIS
ncbi:hypothetical protein [Oceanobacter kriegii]|uniref:hypothetical protein n=1 Tax=Oceanobacter kriegii TaxID=64972 RepID=UPI0004265EFE|nr:hypothetical protein [Oceanobacter kriegii]